MKRIETILFLLGCVLFVGLVWNIGVGELWRQLTSLGWGIIPFLLAEGLAEAIHTVGWRHCLPKNLKSVPLLYLFRVRLAGYAINYFTPTAALGGELTKVSLLTEKGPMTEATSGVLIGKVCFAVAHLLFVALGTVVIVRSVHLSTMEWVSLLASGLLVGAGILTFFLLQKYGKLGALYSLVGGEKPGRTAVEKSRLGPYGGGWRIVQCILSRPSRGHGAGDGLAFDRVFHRNYTLTRGFFCTRSIHPLPSRPGRRYYLFGF